MKAQRSPKWNVTDTQPGQVTILMTSLEGEFVCKVSYFQLKWKTKLYNFLMFRSWGQTSQVLGVRLIRPWITYIIPGSFVSKLILELPF